MFEPYSLDANSPSGHYFGKPLDTIYSKQNSLHLPKYDDVAHLIKSGKLIQIYGDFEASDKDARTATPKDFSALAFDVQGRLLAKVHIPVAIPEHAVYAIDAAMVGHIDVKNLRHGFPEHMAAAQIHDFFQHVSHLHADTLQLGKAEASNGKSLYPYPLRLAGNEELKLLVKPDGKKFYLNGETADRKIYGHWQPFNGEKYDDALLAHWSARLGFASLFPTSRKKHDTIRSDVRVKAMWVWAFGPQGNAGLQLGERQHKRTRRVVLGTRLEDMIVNNTVAANRARGVPGGIRLYDGREFDPEKMHTSDYDTAATAALNFELRRIDPQGMRFVEEIDDADKYKKFLQSSHGYADRPPVGFVYYDQGLLTRGIGVLVATDDTYGDRRKAIMFNLAHDPKNFINLKNNQLRALLVQKNNDPVFVPLDLNKTATVATFERAYLAGAGHDIAPEEYHRRALMISNNRAFIQRVMENWYELTSPTPPVKLVTQREQHENSFSHYGEPKYYILKDGRHYRREPKDVYKRRLQVWRTHNEFDRLLNMATQGHAIEYSNDPVALTDYVERYKDASKKLEKLQTHWKQSFKFPALPSDVFSQDDVRKHLWEMREACMDARFSLYSDAWVVNERGQRQPWQRIITMPDATRKRMWPLREDEAGDSPHYRIKFERNAERYSIITTLQAFEADAFYQKDGKSLKSKWWDEYFQKNWEPSRIWYNAYVASVVRGPPNLDASEHKTPSEVGELKRIERILAAGAAEMAPEYKRVVDSPLGYQRLMDHAAYKKERIKKYKFEPDAQLLMGFDPVTTFPIPNARFYVDVNKTVTLSVPDVLLEAPDWHDAWGNHLVVSRMHAAQLKENAVRLNKGETSLLLVGEATGLMRLAARATCTRLPEQSSDVNATLEKSRAAYSTIGATLGTNPFLLTFEQLAPVHQARSANDPLQHVVMPALEWAGLVDARAGGLPKPMVPRTGIILRDVGQPLKPGPVRLRRSQAGVETGDEYRGHISKAVRITVDDLAKLKDQDAWKFGKLSAGDLQSEWKRLFADLRVDPKDQVLWRIDLTRPVEKETYNYVNKAELPIAVFLPGPDMPPRGKASRGKPKASELGVAA